MFKCMTKYTIDKHQELQHMQLQQQEIQHYELIEQLQNLGLMFGLQLQD